MPEPVLAGNQGKSGRPRGKRPIVVGGGRGGCNRPQGWVGDQGKAAVPAAAGLGG
jgi:hypothetical protein